MTDTPPSIPPRKKPTPPVTGGSARTTPTGATTTDRGAGTGGAETGGATTARSTTVRTSTRPQPAGRSTGPAGARPADASAGDAAPAPASERPAPASAGAEPDDSQEPSPLVTAVDTTTVWLKKAAGATSARLSQAYSQLTRPRSEDPEMTSTDAPVTPAAASTATATAGAPRADAGPAPRPTTGRIPSVGGPRRVRLSVSRVDPWSVMKLAFLLSVAIGIMLVVAAAVLWFTLDGLEVFAQIDALVRTVVGDDSPIQVADYLSFQKTISAATLVAVIDVFLLTALATIGAFLYNLVAALVGGVHVTMTDE
ncbi:DUF3566 domain-containing protein [Cellulomonas telluris]|uniref:DUF3566 domain-containing protein n=1 Tax=Cellulomonas telluris TaxID=2306636 RepID=UPI0010A93518|nr:DUF3566 domain-containing protein [Cellulomonas telluris]